MFDNNFVIIILQTTWSGDSSFVRRILNDMFYDTSACLCNRDLFLFPNITHPINNTSTSALTITIMFELISRTAVEIALNLISRVAVKISLRLTPISRAAP